MKKTPLAAILLLALILILPVHAAQKSDFLTKDYQYCGITQCYTQYTINNPKGTAAAFNLQTFQIAQVIETKGEMQSLDVKIWNGTDWDSLGTYDDKLAAKERKGFSLPKGSGYKIRVYGNISPELHGYNGATYAVDHIPSYEGFTYPEHDLWNQSWNKCFEANITYQLGAYANLNETFPQRIILNSSNLDVARVRSDWGDVRFGKGTCSNVTADYQHVIVNASATQSEMIFHFAPVDIVNNTAARVVIYYNNSAATHVEPSESAIGWYSTSVSTARVRVFTNDKSTDSDSASITAYNSTGEPTLKTFGSSTLTAANIYTIAKKINNATSGLYVEINSSTAEDGYGAGFRFTLNNASIPGTYYLASMRNVTSTTNSGPFELYLTTTAGSGSYEWSDNADSGTVAGNGWYTRTGASVTSYNTSKFNSTPNSITCVGDGHCSRNLTSVNGTCLVYDFYDTGATFQYFGMGNLEDSVTMAAFRNTGVSASFYGATTGDGVNNISTVPLAVGWHNATMCLTADSQRAWIKIDGVVAVNKSRNMTTIAKRVDFYIISGESMRVDNVRLFNGTVEPTGGSPSSVLTLNAYYEGGTKTVNANVGTLQDGVSYPVGFNARKLTTSTHKTILVFNNTVYADDEEAQSGSGYPFYENNTPCVAPVGNDICEKYFAFGMQTVTNLSGDILAAQNSLNGTIDEIILGMSNTGNTSRFSAPFFIAWGSQPAMTFSSTSTSNIYTPSINLTYTPANPLYNQNITAFVNYTDLDPNNGTVIIQWRVNGSLVLTSTFQNVASNTKVNATLTNGNYSKGATINITAWANDSLYTSTNQTAQFLISGIVSPDVTGFACNPLNKTAINCSWVNPGANHSYSYLYRNGSFIANVSNSTTVYTYLLLSPNVTYNLSLQTILENEGVSGGVSNITRTPQNLGPNITSYTPTNLTPTFAENTTQNFTINATDDDGNPVITWFKDNIFQTIANFFTWSIGLNDQGTHNITAIVNDSYGAEARQTWIVTVTDDYPAPTTPRFDPDGGKYRTYIPLSCQSENTFSAVEYYDILISVNGSAYENLSMGNRYGFVQLDITQYNYGSNFTFNCTAYGPSGNSSGVSQQFRKDYVNEFYASTNEKSLSFTSLSPYVFSLYYDAQNPANNVTVEYSYADCNGDGLYDYVYNYTTLNPRRIKQSFACVFPKGDVKFEIGAFIKKNSGDSWAGSGCSQDFDYSNTCKVSKSYGLRVT